MPGEDPVGIDAAADKLVVLSHRDPSLTDLPCPFVKQLLTVLGVEGTEVSHSTGRDQGVTDHSFKTHIQLLYPVMPAHLDNNSDNSDNNNRNNDNYIMIIHRLNM